MQISHAGSGIHITHNGFALIRIRRGKVETVGIGGGKFLQFVSGNRRGGRFAFNHNVVESHQTALRNGGDKMERKEIFAFRLGGKFKGILCPRAVCLLRRLAKFYGLRFLGLRRAGRHFNLRVAYGSGTAARRVKPEAERADLASHEREARRVDNFIAHAHIAAHIAEHVTARVCRGTHIGSLLAIKRNRAFR